MHNTTTVSRRAGRGAAPAPTPATPTRARRSRRRAAGAWTALLAAPLAPIAIVAPDAHAGTAIVYACTTPDGLPAPADGWLDSFDPGYRGYVGTGSSCPWGGLYGRFFSPQTSWYGGLYARWTFTAPPGTALVRMDYERVLRGLHAGDWNYIAAIDGSIKDAMLPARDTAGRASITAMDGRNATFTLQCGAGGGDCYRTGNESAAAMAIGRIDSHLRDADPPVVTNVSGSLASAALLRGSEDIAYTVSDQGLGAYRTLLEVDGVRQDAKVVDPNDGRCQDARPGAGEDYEFLYTVPCRLAATPDQTFSVSKLSAGEHKLKLSVEDAAGNTTTFVNRLVTIQHFPEAGAVRAAPVAHRNGANASAQATLTVRRPGYRRKAITVRYARRAALIGRLRDPAGQPIAGARVEVTTQAQRPGAPPNARGSVVTNRRGAFRWVLPVGPSRVVRFAYRARLEDAEPAKVTAVLVRVLARVRLRATPRQLSNGETVTFTGRVPGAPAGSHPLVEVEAAKPGGGWFRAAKTHLRNGRFVAHYPFKSTTQPRIYTFRAVVNDEPGFPFLTSASRRVHVTVRP